jgi:hypothetical protein
VRVLFIEGAEPGMAQEFLLFRFPVVVPEHLFLGTMLSVLCNTSFACTLTCPLGHGLFGERADPN